MYLNEKLQMFSSMTYTNKVKKSFNMQANNSKILKKVQYIAFILCKIQFKQKKAFHVEGFFVV